MKLTSPKLWIKSKFFWWGISVILVITTATFYILKEKEETLRRYTQKQLDKTINEKITIGQKLINTIRTKEIVEQKLSIETEKNIALAKELEDKARQIEFTLDRLQKELNARHEAETRLIMILEEKRILEAKVKEFAKPAKAIELEEIVIKAKPLVAGKVLMVNKEYAFIVIDLGRRDNLRLGDVLLVYRDNKFIGKVQVEKIEEMVSAAAILSDWQDVEFNEKDEVRKI